MFHICYSSTSPPIPKSVFVCLDCHKKYHRLCGSNNRNLFLSVLESEFQYLGAGHLVSGESLPACTWTPSCCILMVGRKKVCAYSLVCLLIRMTILLYQGSTLTTSFNLNYLLIGSFSECSHVGS